MNCVKGALLLFLFALCGSHAAERAALQFSRGPDLVETGSQTLGLVVTAVDGLGNPVAIEDPAESFTISTLNGDGTVPMAPETSAREVVEGRLRVSVVVPENAVAPWTIRVSDSNGIVGQTLPMDVRRRIPGSSSAVVWD